MFLQCPVISLWLILWWELTHAYLILLHLLYCASQIIHFLQVEDLWQLCVDRSSNVSLYIISDMGNLYFLFYSRSCRSFINVINLLAFWYSSLLNVLFSSLLLSASSVLSSSLSSYFFIDFTFFKWLIHANK